MAERAKPSDRQTKIDTGERIEVGLAVITQADGYLLCSCGAPFIQPRAKIREEAAQRHLDRKHNGRGLWL